MEHAGQLYFDDLKLGDRWRSAGRTLGDAHFVLFAGVTGDNHPIHYDEEHARRTRFGGRVAHGLLLMAMTALGASPLSSRLEDAMIAFVEQGCRVLEPGLLNDTIHAQVKNVRLERTREPGRVRLEGKPGDPRGAAR